MTENIGPDMDAFLEALGDQIQELCMRAPGVVLGFTVMVRDPADGLAVAHTRTAVANPAAYMSALHTYTVEERSEDPLGINWESS